jgi:DnaJ-class molecular chaperone
MLGVATCKNYELLLTILQDYHGEASEDNTDVPVDDFIDWYEVLEVEPSATVKEIQTQFRKLISTYHPDRAPTDKKDEYHKKAVLLNQAKAILCDVAKRKEFDELRNNRA